MGERQAARRAVAREVARSYAYVLLWMSISMGVILFNKWLLAYSGFPYPIALTMWHMTFCSAVAFACVRVFKVVKSHDMAPREYAARVMPIGLLYAGSLWLSNSAYLYLSVSFIQMTKSLMPGLVYACGCLAGTERPRRSAALNMLLIAAGVGVCALGEVNLVPRGLAQQLAALAFEAARLTLVQVLMTGRGLAMNPLQSLYYVSPACLAALLPAFALAELPRMRAAAAALHVSAPVLLANALAAFALNLSVFLLIGKTSALTMNIAGVVKDWLLIFASWRLFGAPVTALNLAGYVFCCSGVVIYNHQKLADIRRRVAAEQQRAGDGQGDAQDTEQHQWRQGAGVGGAGGARGAAAAGGGALSGQSSGSGDEDGGAVVDVVVAHRSKGEILSEIRRLQAEAARSGRAGGGGGGGGGGWTGSGADAPAGALLSRLGRDAAAALGVGPAAPGGGGLGGRGGGDKEV